jgi:hypothetical protein
VHAAQDQAEATMALSTAHTLPEWLAQGSFDTADLQETKALLEVRC